MQGVEALYVVEFGDVAVQGFRNGGVVVLETNRVFGGDSGYYYLGSFSISGGAITANVKIVKHNPTWVNAFGDAALQFDVKMTGTIGNGVMNGHMERLDKPGLRLPIRLTRKADLP